MALPHPHLSPAQHTSKWWFILGHEPLLSAAEVFSVLQCDFTNPSLYSYSAKLLKIKAPCNPTQTIQTIGGTIKIGRELSDIIPAAALINFLVNHLSQSEGKIHFGISVYRDSEPRVEDDVLVEQWAKEIKNLLKKADRSARYISGDKGVLSSATVFHNKLHESHTEFLLSPNSDGTYSVAATEAVQPLEDFSSRDFGRPGRDKVSGMLPPKLALMMINLAGGDKNKTFLDPFCGSGTILTEAIRLGYKSIIGSDLSDKAMKDTQKNIEWTLQQHPTTTTTTPTLFHLDVTLLSTKIFPHSTETIVTEPYMGPPLRGRESGEQVKKTCAELANLYTRSFEEFTKILNLGASVVFIVPRFFIEGKWFTISDRIIPKLKELGFTKERLLPETLTPMSYILYHRSDQHVGREIWKFTFNK